MADAIERKLVIILKTYGIMSLQFQTQWVLLLLISSFSNFQNNLPKIPWKNDWLQIQKRKQLWPKPAHKKALDSDLMLGLFVYVSGMLGNRGTRYKVPFKEVAYTFLEYLLISGAILMIYFDNISSIKRIMKHIRKRLT